MSNLLENKTPNDLIIYFIGEYGERILNQFRHWRKRYPILNRCRNVSMNILSEEHLIYISDISGLDAENCHKNNPNVACFIFDSSQHDTTLLAITMAERLPDAIRLCFSPDCSESMIRNVFNMVINTSYDNRDATARVLITIYNTYLGCGQMGNIQCLKYLFSAIEIADHHYFTRVGLALQKEKKSCYDLEKLVADAIHGIRDSMWHDETFIGLLEMNPEINAIHVLNEILPQFKHKHIDNISLIAHLSIKQKTMRLTLLSLK